MKHALQQYEGTFLIVSHDREFLDGLTNRIWDIENKTLKIHHFGVHEYLQRKLNTTNESAPSLKKKPEATPVKVETKTEAAPVNNEERKEWKRQRNQLTSKIRQLEEQIKKLEAEVEKLNSQLATLDFTDTATASPVLKSFEQAKQQLDETTDAWMEASEALEAIPAI